MSGGCGGRRIGFVPQDNGTKPPDDKKNHGFDRHDKNAVDSARYAAVAIDKNGIS
ncbi:His Kinase A [human gut metagenome]|uniref:His Kinase A n=1 Tax=human gut metagenome TaxID=408170 RepID=K1SBU2_9ZZZZ